MPFKNNNQEDIRKTCNGQANHHIYHPETPFVVLPCNAKSRQECCKGSNNDEGGREETSRKAQIEVDGQSAERFERTQLNPKLTQNREAWRKAIMAIDPGKG